MLQAFWQDVFGCPILHLQTCLAVPGWLCFSNLIVPEMLLVLGPLVLAYPRVQALLKICLSFFGFDGLSPYKKPLLPLRVSWLRSTGESSVHLQSEK